MASLPCCDRTRISSAAIRSMTSSHETSTKGDRPRSPPRPSSQPARTAGLSIRAVPFRLPAMLSFRGDGSGSDGCPRTDVTRPSTVVTSPIPQWLEVSTCSSVPSTSVIPGLPVDENAWHIARELSLASPARTWLFVSAFPAGCPLAGRGRTPAPGHTRAMQRWPENSANRVSAAHIGVPDAASTPSRDTTLSRRPDTLHTARAKK